MKEIDDLVKKAERFLRTAEIALDDGGLRFMCFKRVLCDVLHG
jgi:HEPN domain-containing protein